MSLNKKNILFIESGTTGGGSFESILQHLKCMPSSQFKFFIVCLNETKYNSLWEQYGATVFLISDPLYTLNKSIKSKLIAWSYALFRRFPFWVFKEFIRLVQIKTIKKVAEIVRQNRIDIIQLNNQPLRDLYGLLVSKKTRVPCLAHIRSMRTNAVPHNFPNFANKVVSRFIPNSVSSGTFWNKMGFSDSLMTVIYNVVSTDLQIELSSRPRIKDQTQIALGCLANFSEAKGHQFLLYSFARLLQDNSNYVLYLAGKGPGEPSLKSLIEDLNISEKVIFMGYQENITGFFNKIDILIVPSRSEAFGRVILESWAQLKPIVATKVGGIVELIESGTNGLLINYENIDEMTQSILKLSKEEDLYLRLATQGKLTLKNKFSVETYKRDFNSLYTGF